MSTFHIIEILHQEHQHAFALLDRLRETSGKRKRLNLAFDLQNALIPHMLAEEKEIYPLLRNEGGLSASAADEALSGHEELRRQLQSLSETPVDEEQFEKKIDLVREALRRHLDREEAEIFPRVQILVPEARAEDVVQRFCSERDRNRRTPQEVTGRNWWM